MSDDRKAERSGAAEEAIEGPQEGPGKSHYAIRILANGDVVFGDLPEGLLDVAHVLSGTATDGQSGHGDADADAGADEGR